MVLHPPITARQAIRRYSVGAEVVHEADGSARVHARVWAPTANMVELVIEDDRDGVTASPLAAEAHGYYSGFVTGAEPGTRYRFRLDGQDAFPDPASRFQPDGPHGPSVIVDPSRFAWTDADWRGVSIEGQVICELHVGTFTEAGTYRSAIDHFPQLVDAGITVLEIMPLAEFAGRFGWGYDGVDLFAPSHLYGTPDDLRAFVDAAHRLGVGVILDVVYNHFGPDGNYLKEYSEHYFTDRYANEWGEAINFDGPDSGPVREFFIGNAGYWISEFHLDGLRLDATQQIFDSSADNVMAAMTRQVRASAKGRGTYIVAENEPQHTVLVRSPENGGYGMDALWNDDFHHEAMVTLTGRAEAYYSDYKGTPQEYISALKWGYLYQGQRYKWQKKRRGSPTFGLAPSCFVNYIQNHDQVANSLRGLRAHMLASPGQLKALTALLLLGPGSPMLFQGQEYAASQPFFYFADHNPELAKLVAKGRKEFLSQFRTIACPETEGLLNNPESEETFRRCKLNFAERETHSEIYRLHRDLLKLRRDDPVLSQPRAGGMDGAVLGAQCFVLRFFGEEQNDRILLVNFGMDLHLDPAPEPLLAPPKAQAWAVQWSSEDPGYGGCGTPPLESEENWLVPGQAAVFMVPEPLPDEEHGEHHPQN